MDVETQRAKAEALRELHKGPEILILPNAWNVGSARFLAGGPLAKSRHPVARNEGPLYPQLRTLGGGSRHE